MQEAFDPTAFAHWLAANSKASPALPATADRQRQFSADPSRPVVANSILAGTKAMQALQLDRAYVAASDQDKIEALALAPATGCAMLLTLAREKSGYNPNLPAQLDSEAKFLSYIYQITVCPLFRKEIDDQIAQVFEGNWNNVIALIISFYTGLPDKDKELLRQSLTSVAAAASSNPSTWQKICTFFQTTLDCSDDISTFLYYMNVRMITYVEHGGKNEPDYVHNQAHLTLHRVKMKFDSAQWPSYAADVYRETNSSLADWLEDNSSRIGALPHDWHPR